MQKELADSSEHLNAAFFQGEAGEWREALARQEEEAHRELALASGIGDEALVARLAALGIRAETLAALTLVPLVEVAWADGKMDAKERDAILRGAASAGISEGSWSYRLLEIWTHDRPTPELFQVWGDFIAALAGQLSRRERTEFQHKIVGRAREVAEAAAGFLGLGPRVSGSEREVLERLELAFAVPPADGP